MSSPKNVAMIDMYMPNFIDICAVFYPLAVKALKGGGLASLSYNFSPFSNSLFCNAVQKSRDKREIWRAATLSSSPVLSWTRSLFQSQEKATQSSSLTCGRYLAWAPLFSVPTRYMPIGSVPSHHSNTPDKRDNGTTCQIRFHLCLCSSQFFHWVVVEPHQLL